MRRGPKRAWCVGAIGTAAAGAACNLCARRLEKGLTPHRDAPLTSTYVHPHVHVHLLHIGVLSCILCVGEPGTESGGVAQLVKHLFATMETMAVTVPQGMAPGMTMTVNVKGQDLQLTIPDGIQPGMQFQFQVPAKPEPIQPVMAQPVMAQPVMGQTMAQNYAQPSQVIVQQPPQQVVVMQQQPMRTEQYCGVISWLIGCFVPCGCWICFCPIDERLVPADQPMLR